MKSSKLIIGGTLVLVLLCTLPSCSFLNDFGDGAGTPTSFGDNKREMQYIEWCDNLPRYIIPRMCDYYQLHPERFKPTGNGEEIKIDGFGVFVKDDAYFKSANPYRCSIINGKIYDPWGHSLHFVQDLNMDGYIDVENLHCKVLEMGVPGKPAGLNGQHHFGIYKSSPFKGASGKPWERILAITY